MLFRITSNELRARSRTLEKALGAGCGDHLAVQRTDRATAVGECARRDWRHPRGPCPNTPSAWQRAEHSRAYWGQHPSPREACLRWRSQSSILFQDTPTTIINHNILGYYHYKILPLTLFHSEILSEKCSNPVKKAQIHARKPRNLPRLPLFLCSSCLKAIVST